MSATERILKRRLAEARQRLADAQERGETDAYLALCRHEIDKLEAALGREGNAA